MTTLKAQRLADFINWCSKVPFTQPLTKGLLSKEYVKQTKSPLAPYYFSITVPNELLAESVQNADLSLEAKARLMCLFSLPVDPSFFDVLNQFAIIELDEYRRIIRYQYGPVLIRCKHNKPRNKKRPRASRESGDGNNGGGGEDVGGEESEGQEDEEYLEILEQESTPATPSHIQQLLYNTQNAAVQPTPNMNYNVTSTSSMPPPIQNSNFQQPWQTPTLKHDNSWNMGSVREQSTGFDNKPTSSESSFESVLQKLEFFFLYKCRPELMPLCLRIKEVKENEARFSQKIIQESTIRSFFDVFLRLMVINLPPTPVVKMEPTKNEISLLLNDFLIDLKNQRLMNDIDEIIDNLLAEGNNRQKITYNAISNAFLEIVNNLAKFC